MSPIENLPTEIVQYIAELCTWDSAPPEDGFPSQIDIQRYKHRGEWRVQSYARYHAAFARTSRHFHAMLNKQLYIRNLYRDPNIFSCIRWAVEHNRLETIKRAHKYGADLNSYGPDPHITTLPNNRGSEDRYVKVNGILVPDSTVTFTHSGSPLFDAVSYEFKEIVEYLLEAKVEVDKEVPGIGSYPMLRALSSMSENIALMLANRGAYLIHEGVSALPMAHAWGFHRVVKILLRENDPVSLTGKLLVGASSDDLKLVTEGLKHPDVDVNDQRSDGNTALHLAIVSAKGKLDVIKFILQQPKIRLSIPNAFGEVPIHVAARRRRMDMVQLLEKMPDFDINCRTPKNETVLHMAAKGRDKDIFSYLLHHPALRFPQDGYRRDQDLSSLMDICLLWEDVLARDLLKLLFESGAQLKPGRYQVVNAIKHGKLLTASKLVSIISQENFDREYGRGAQNADFGLLHYALCLQHPHLATFVRESIARGVNIQLAPINIHAPQAISGIATPLFFATAFARNTDCMKMLLEAGADVNSPVRVRVAPGRGRRGCRTMSILSGLFSYAWRERQSIVECPIQYAGLKKMEIPITEGMSELEGPISMLLQHGATLNMVGDCPSALSLVCTEAVESSSLSVLKWLTNNATTSNVSIGHVDSLLGEFPLVEDKPVQRELHNILQGFKERLLRGGNQD